MKKHVEYSTWRYDECRFDPNVIIVITNIVNPNCRCGVIYIYIYIYIYINLMTCNNYLQYGYLEKGVIDVVIPFMI
jgi:hypothetical protein